jgi:hypothetical protein
MSLVVGKRQGRMMHPCPDLWLLSMDISRFALALIENTESLFPSITCTKIWLAWF